ncbi:MAG: hypothetical protein A2857_05735 [Candidatus Levybacteria bacterium RIFCSPHIGHO2_01_FULL_36_15]|nr:MAG: hypothetical protein A2857_05735 [Candidatus Levybacteria bacterium RIFCSPHIGHO2_01_FULL_36_15]OGH38435.1 MAG: hypothetical protein A2905_00535 [Candidatus Levybacteria bacterium RIFCSPLOWO2_01_FULL_36_10]
MRERIKEEVLAVYKKIQDSDFEVYFIGGCVRDILMGKDVTDWDLTTNATPEKIQTLFPDSFYDNKFGTVGVPFKNTETGANLDTKNYIEVTTFRTEKGYGDKRHPEIVQWGKSLEEDVARRDFTINSIAFELKFSNSAYDIKIIDYFNGQEDIKNKIIKTVGNPYARFKEDALRLIRAIRFASKLGFMIEPETWKAIMEDAPLIKFISNERIRDELLKTLESENAYNGIQMLDKSGLLQFIIPELIKGKGLSQERPGRHHKSDVFTHSLLSLKHVPSKDPIIRLAALLHDVGKPETASLDQDRLITFHNHEVIGAKMASQIADRLKLSKKQKGKIYTLIRWHMFSIDDKITDSAIRRFIRRVGFENVKDIIDLRIGDRLGSGVEKAESWRLKKFKERVEKELHPPFSMNDLAVDGHDIMRELNITPGPKIGKILSKLFEEAEEDLSKNNREHLLKRVKDLAIEIKD